MDTATSHSRHGLSVVLCTHNPRQEFLARTLESLQKQDLPQDRWELVIVDNASQVGVNTRFDLSWHAHSRVVLEPNLGLTHARLCGIASTDSEILVFVDDDNLLDPNYLTTASRLLSEFPGLGAIGGQCIPEF